MSAKEDILIAARGGLPKRIPWTITQDILPRGQIERYLRTSGLSLVASVPQTSSEIFQWGPDVEVALQSSIDGHQIIHKKTYRTHLGELTELIRPSIASGMAGMAIDWKMEFMVKQPSDYAVLEYLIRGQIFKPDFNHIVQIQQELGDDGVVICKIAKTPFQLLWMEYTGLERLIFDLFDNPKPVHGVMEAMTERDKKIWSIMARSPADLFYCTDNLSGNVVSPSIFEQYFLPYYRALTEIIDPSNKPIAVHADGLLRSLTEKINQLPEGMIIEAFTPLPTGDLSLAEARAIWGKRPIWINFPSSVHLEPTEKVEEITLEILSQAAPGKGILFGITENIPANCWKASLSTIGKVLELYGTCPLEI